MPWLERIIEHYKKFALGFGAATVVTGLIFAAFNAGNFVEKEVISGSVYVLCGVVALYWIRFTESGFIRRRIENDRVTGCKMIIGPEEHLAYVANKFARNFFGRRRTITYAEYRSWRQLNKLLFTAVICPDRDLLGFFDVFPLNDSAGQKIRNGIKGESDISIDDIMPESRASEANYIYVASVMSCTINDFFDVKLLDYLIEFLGRFYPPRDGRTYLAFDATKQGRNLLRRNNFVMELDAEMTSCKRDLFVLDAANVTSALKRFDRNCMSPGRRPGKRLSRTPAQATQGLQLT